MTNIEAKNNFLIDIMKEKHYKIEYYQREYAWRDKEVKELLDDLIFKFRESYNEKDSAPSVSNYKEYFLGSIVIARKTVLKDDGEDVEVYIVDGQQRMTTLTLLFSYIYKRLDRPAVKMYISSEEYGQEKYNIFVKDRIPVMDYILHDKQENVAKKFVENHRIYQNYNIISEYFDNLDMSDKELEYFYYWLERKVIIVTIEVKTSEEAYSIFESMNDRGRPLTNAEMLKGYILSLITDKREEATELWEKIRKKFKTDKDFNDFLVLLFRSRYVNSKRRFTVGNNLSLRDEYKYIGKSYYKFIKEKRKGIVNIHNSKDAYNFLVEIDYYADLYFDLLEKTKKKEKGYEGLYYVSRVHNSEFFLIFLGVITPFDEQKDDKIKVIAKFMDVRSGLLAWNLKNMYTNSTVGEYLTALNVEIRKVEDKDILVLTKLLYEQLVRERKSGSAWNNEISLSSTPSLSDNHNRRENIFYILARVTEFLELADGRSSIFSELYDKKYEIEHVLAANHEVNKNQFPTQDELDLYRNKIGGLGLLEKGINASFGDKKYEDKVKKYASHNRFLGILSESLYSPNRDKFENHPGLNRLVKNNPSLLQLIKPSPTFGKKEINERNELITEIAKIIWNPADFQKYLSEIDDSLTLEELSCLVEDKINDDSLPEEESVDITSDGMKLGVTMSFSTGDTCCEFEYLNSQKIKITKIVNAPIISNPIEIFKNHHTPMIQVHQSIMKNAQISDNMYNWNGNVTTTIKKAPIYLATGSTHKTDNGERYTIKTHYFEKENKHHSE